MIFFFVECPSRWFRWAHRGSTMYCTFNNPGAKPAQRSPTYGGKSFAVLFGKTLNRPRPRGSIFLRRFPHAC